MALSFNKRYFDGDVSHGFASLFTGKAITMIATGLIGLFLPIFLYNLFGQNFQRMVIYYGAGYFLYAVMIFAGARFLNKFGFRMSLRLSVIFGALFYLIFYFINKDNLFYLIPLSIIALIFFRLLHWLPYNVDLAKFTDKKNRGREISVLAATQTAVVIFIPAISGYLINKFGFDVLFMIAIFIYLASGIPYLIIPRTNEKFSWSYSETWKQFFSKERRNMILAYAADGAENVAGAIVWPVFIFQLLRGDYLQVGLISTFIMAATVILQLLVGKYIDYVRKDKIFHLGSALYSLGWIIKIFITTAFQIFIVGFYHSFVSIFMRTPFDVMTYEIAADNGHYVDEFTVLREMAVNFGRCAMIVLVIVASAFFAIQWTFILAAISALLFSLLRPKDGMLMPRVVI